VLQRALMEGQDSEYLCDGEILGRALFHLAAAQAPSRRLFRFSQRMAQLGVLPE
jgi:hypothetical protein